MILCAALSVKATQHFRWASCHRISSVMDFLMFTTVVFSWTSWWKEYWLSKVLLFLLAVKVYLKVFANKLQLCFSLFVCLFPCPVLEFAKFGLKDLYGYFRKRQAFTVRPFEKFSSFSFLPSFVWILFSKQKKKKREPSSGQDATSWRKKMWLRARQTEAQTREVW